jgi:hypothetical protein
VDGEVGAKRLERCGRTPTAAPGYHDHEARE